MRMRHCFLGFRRARKPATRPSSATQLNLILRSELWMDKIHSAHPNWGRICPSTEDSRHAADMSSSPAGKYELHGDFL